MIRLFVKPDFNAKKEKEDLISEINRLQIKYEKLQREIAYLEQKKEGSLTLKEQELLNKEFELDKDKKSVMDLANSLGERKMLLDKREKLIEGKELILKEKENAYIFRGT